MTDTSEQPLKPPIKERYDFIYLFDVENGNPNGDPDGGNAPRINEINGRGLVTDACLKRKVREYVRLMHGYKTPYDIYVKMGGVLEEEQRKAYEAKNLKPLASDKQDQKDDGGDGDSGGQGKPKKNAAKIPDSKNVAIAQKWLCENYFDIRAFGAVLNVTNYRAGVLTGPVQFGIAQSIDPISPQELTLTRSAVTKVADRDKERTMGTRHIVPYGLYRMYGSIRPHFAQRTGFNEDDLKLLWEALLRMFEMDKASARGLMSARGLYIFKHKMRGEDNAEGIVLGNAPERKLFDLLHVQKRDGVEEAASFEDYDVTIDRDGVPDGVGLQVK